MASAMTLIRLALFNFAQPNNVGEGYSASVLDSIPESLDSNTDIASVLAAYSMEGMLQIAGQWVQDSAAIASQMMPLIPQLVVLTLG